MQPPTRGRPTQPGRGRAPARWTGIEIALILLSAVMIAYPLFAGALGFVAPPVAPAQESTPEPPAEPPTDTPDPVFEEPATETPEPPADTAVPPADTAVPPPADTAVPPADTAVPPAPTDTAAPPAPTSTLPPGGEQISTATSRPITPTSTPDPSSPTPTSTTGATTPSPTSTTNPNVTPSSTSTTNPNVTPSSTSTSGPVTGVEVFKVASVSEAAPGQNFSYSVSVITRSATDQQVTMTDGVDSRLEVLGASSGSGSCSSGQTVSCSLTIRSDNPASVTIQVRVRPDVAPGTDISNDASAGGASSGSVVVRVAGSVVTSPTPSPTGPTATPSPSPTGPTATPSPSPTGPTATPSATTVVVPPTVTPRPPDRPDPPRPPSQDRPASTAVPPAPPAPPTPIPGVPTEPPTPEQIIIFDPSQPQVRPTAAVRPTRVPVAATNTPSSLIPIPTGTSGTAEPTSGPAGGGTTDIFFRIASDWGSAYPGQQVNFTIVVRNTRPPAADGANDLRNLRASSTLPGNVQVLGARADRGSDPVVSGNAVSYSIDRLQPGEGVEITVASQIRPDVTIGTLLVAQAQLLYDGLAQPAFSNIVSVQVVGNAQPPTAAAVGGSPVAQQATATTGAYPPPSTGTAVRASATPVRTNTPTAPGQQATAVPPTAVPPRPQPAPLPDTSTGVPLIGIALLGSTLLTRTWRLHRAKSRL